MPQMRDEKGKFKSPFKHCGTKTPPRKDCFCGRCSAARIYKRQHLRDQRRFFPEFIERDKRRQKQVYHKDPTAHCMYQQMIRFLKKDRKGIPWEQYLGPVKELAD